MELPLHMSLPWSNMRLVYDTCVFRVTIFPSGHVWRRKRRWRCFKVATRNIRVPITGVFPWRQWTRVHLQMTTALEVESMTVGPPFTSHHSRHTFNAQRQHTHKSLKGSATSRDPVKRGVKKHCGTSTWFGMTSKKQQPWNDFTKSTFHQPHYACSPHTPPFLFLFFLFLSPLPFPSYAIPLLTSSPMTSNNPLSLPQ